MTEGDLPLGDRLSRLEESVARHQTIADRWILGVLLLATLPFGSFLAGLARKGEPGKDGAPGFGAPIGAVVAWPGAVPDDDDWRSRWRVCDGTSALGNRELWRVLGGLYENPPWDPGESEDVPEILNLPDFQGMFLRGSGGSGMHMSGPLGQQQSDLFKSHNHRLRAYAVKEDVDNGVNWALVNFGQESEPGGQKKKKKQDIDDSVLPLPNASSEPPEHGAETRPVNFAVQWVIRVR